LSPGAQYGILWPLLVYFGLIVALVAGLMLLSYFLGERHREKATGQPYESGIISTGSARIRFDVKFYFLAMLFVIFDLEAVFVMAWAIALKESGWRGYFEMLIFIAVLLVGLLYLWRTGMLDWGAGRKPPLMRPEK
jgi:NADH-quinone oxidoreductase subunit A